MDDEMKVLNLARELYGAYAETNRVEFWDEENAFIDRGRFINMARAAIAFLDTYEEDDFMRAFDFDDHFADVITE